MDKKIIPGQVVSIIGGKYKGQAGEVRAIKAETGQVTVRIGADYRTIKAENIEGGGNGAG